MSAETEKTATPESAHERSPLAEDIIELPIQHKSSFGQEDSPLQEEINCLFNEVFEDSSIMEDQDFCPFPRIDTAKNRKFIKFSAALPGLKPDDIKIYTTYNFVTITGDKAGNCPGGFRRICPLPDNAAPFKARAFLKNGTLNIIVPRTPEKQEEPA